ncbi:Rieske (2Fe-2S) protein [Acinetobacter sp. WZC-1]|uniref:Rieske (2Fe-2S) protein n=1 Tax=Acinetobacter sp. WZC-1 TaxID=3459034 RepID=UPI00403D9ECB
MAERIQLCHIDAFHQKQAVKLKHPFRPEISIVVIHRDGQYFGYENVCPHFSVQLDYREGEFSIYNNEVIMCAHHSALFNIQTGECIDGPCKGQHLSQIKCEVMDRILYFNNCSSSLDIELNF